MGIAYKLDVLWCRTFQSVLKIGNYFMGYRMSKYLEGPGKIKELGAFYAGRAFTRGCVGYVHAIGHTLGGLYGVAHGLAMAVLLPHVMREFGASAHKRLAELAFGNATDCVRLALEEKPQIDKLDLSLLSEIKRNDKGTVEIKLVNRLLALEQLSQLAGSDTQEAADFLAALRGEEA